MTTSVSILIPAHNEADYLSTCLEALFASSPLPAETKLEVLVIANGCTDDTVTIAQSLPEPDGWTLRVVDLPKGGKLAALNAGDTAAQGDILIYLDADVLVDKGLLGQIISALQAPTPRYASGSPRVSPAKTFVTRSYARLWSQLPFVTQDVPGFGIFAMNRQGRARWGQWPQIISDDTFARLQFQPAERVRVAAGYSWPMVEGFRNLVRVRRRQDAGVSEIATTYPNLLKNDSKPPVGMAKLLKLFMTTPVGFVIYALVSLAVKSPLFKSSSSWARGR